MDVEKLAKRIEKEFNSSRSDARRIAEKASKFGDFVHSDPERWEGPSEIDGDYIISRLDMAPEHLSVTGKWNWWAGIQKYLNDADYKIK